MKKILYIIPLLVFMNLTACETEAQIQAQIEQTKRDIHDARFLMQEIQQDLRDFDAYAGKIHTIERVNPAGDSQTFPISKPHLGAALARERSVEALHKVSSLIKRQSAILGRLQGQLVFVRGQNGQLTA